MPTQQAKAVNSEPATTMEIEDLEVESSIEKIRRQGIQILIAGFFTNFIVFGVGFTYGVFQEFYLSPEGPLSHESAATVALIGTLATSITYMGAVFLSTIRKYVPTNISMCVGGILLSMGLICASWCTKVWQFALTQGIMFGLGSSATYIPPIVFAPQYFNKHRGIAMGIVFAGTGFGSLVFAFLTRYLIVHLGWQWAVRILGFISMAVTMVCSQFVHPHPNFLSNTGSILVSSSVLKSRKFNLQMFGALLQAMAYLVPLVYMASYGTTLGFSSNQGATFIAINNVVNAISKVVLGHFADNIGKINMLTLCCGMSMITVYALWLIPNRSTFISFVVLYGVTSGPIISLIPACLSETFGVQTYYSVSGMLYLFRGIGNLLGSPIAGLLIKGNPGNTSSYFNVIQYTGAALAASTICSAVMALTAQT
ncbi:CIC11C00000002367 [Sungouiella intermedia]|uniref:CIC11C00000002367 n=1 Tax=Sungouiella intermedia TaxID=45354 RepID=A0A1L0BYG5_9ASCO|nr:CIC11C00000002367 [[Candida] intermedia]